MESREWPDKGFGIIVFRRFNELQGNIERQVNKIGKIIHEKMRCITEKNHLKKKTKGNSGAKEYN